MKGAAGTGAEAGATRRAELAEPEGAMTMALDLGVRG